MGFNLSAFDFTISHEKGENIPNADALSGLLCNDEKEATDVE